MNDTIINDSYIVSKYMIHTNKKDMIRPSFNKMINLNENNQDKLYLLQRYKDSESLHETVQRIFYKIEIKPICPICGAPVKWLGKKKRLMLKTCSDVKCFGKFRYDEAKKTNLLKYGVENCYQSLEKQEKIRNTLISKYGVDNPLKSEKIKEKLKHTCLIKYGVTNGGWTPQSIKKIQETNLKVRGVTCPFKDDKVKEKIKNTCLKKYGVSSASKSKEIKEKIRNTCLKKYGTEYYFQSNEYRKDLYAYLEKQRQTKKKNHTYTSSKAENIIYNKLVHYFNKVICQFYDKERYPYNCDFYIPEIDTFIEYQGYYSHQNHPFDPFNKDDIKLKNDFIEKINNGKLYYQCVINTWCDSDVKKRNKAKENNLNYIEFWNIDEVDIWLQNYEKKY